MSLTLFIDSYASLADINALMVSNKQWQALEVYEKEDFIKAATQLIDATVHADGDLLSSVQPLVFLRDYGDADHVIFGTVEQTRRLKLAVFYQCALYLENEPQGRINFQEEATRITPLNTLAPNASNQLKVYMIERWQINTDETKF